MSKAGNKKPNSPSQAHGDDVPLRLVLYVTEPNGGAPKTLATKLKPQLVVGRTSSDTPVPIDIDLSPFDAQNTGVSRMHATFHFHDGALEIEDHESTNGTRINGFQLQSGRRYRLRNGDELEFGRLQMVVKVIRPPH
ncbi:MAG: FHA domain-containing protein [Anaerolineae bacterium]